MHVFGIYFAKSAKNGFIIGTTVLKKQSILVPFLLPVIVKKN
jgi:hypothetical protein